MEGVCYTKPVRAVGDIRFQTIDEQQKFLEVAKYHTITNSMHDC